MLGKGLLKGLGITARHTFEREITQQYPEERPYLQDRYRGSLEYDYPKCIACGQCVKACPNRVITLETYRDEGAKKKKVERYTIDLQYCLFCNLCVEICPTATLYFSHDFELTKAVRGDIKKVYHRPLELELVPAGKTAVSPAETTEATVTGEADAKRLKQVEAIQSALAKNPAKTLAKILPTEKDVAVMIALMYEDDQKRVKLAELLVDDRDKAAKLAAAWVKKGKPADGAETESIAGPDPAPTGEPAETAAGDRDDNNPLSPADDSGSGNGPLQVEARLAEADSKRLRQIEAMKGALAKNPLKTLARILPDEQEAAVMTALMDQDEKKRAKLAELLVDDRDKAAKLAAAWVAKDKKGNPGEGGLNQ